MMDERNSYEEVGDVIAALDTLFGAVESHVESLKGELEQSYASGDPRYSRRVERGITWGEELLDILEEQAQERVMYLRSNAHQLGFARQGKMV